jgi:hypothetical protein
MKEMTSPPSNSLFATPWGYALMIVPCGAIWWAVLRGILLLPYDLALVAMLVPIGVFTWLVTPPPEKRTRATI